MQRTAPETTDERVERRLEAAPQLVEALAGRHEDEAIEMGCASGLRSVSLAPTPLMNVWKMASTCDVAASIDVPGATRATASNHQVSAFSNSLAFEDDRQRHVDVPAWHQARECGRRDPDDRERPVAEADGAAERLCRVRQTAAAHTRATRPRRVASPARRPCVVRRPAAGERPSTSK